MDDLIQEFIGETREGLEALDSELVRFEQHPDDPALLGGIFRLIHTIKGTSGFLSLMRLQAVAHAAENVLGAFRDGELAVSPEAVSAILETVDLIRGLTDALGAGGEEPSGDDSALIGRLEALLHATPAAAATQAAPANASRPLIERLGGDATLDMACEMILDDLCAGEPADALGAVDRDALQFSVRDGVIAVARGGASRATVAADLSALCGPAAADAVLARLPALLAAALQTLEIDPAHTEALSDLLADDTAPATDPMLEPADDVRIEATSAVVAQVALAPASPTEGEPASANQTIRVSVDALEHLMTVVSELVLIRNQLIQTLRLEPESPFAAPLNRLNQVTSELQEGVMTTRMQPISGAWAKLPRLARDLANELGKKIDLVMIGQETELDRQVLELIKDPLTHMVRNAADHGLETPEERRAAGKSETGRITLAARHEGGAIVIEVADDGRGLAVAKIRAKALASGLVTASQVETMSDADIRHFIFAAGFSTASQVTSVSGRGVGMDVVRTNIEKIGGAIELASSESAGTRFIIRIPLTLTIVSTLIVECCGERFAIPQSSVMELVSASDASNRQIEHVDGAAVLRLRDRLLPLISLQGLLNLDPERAISGETCIVVARVGAFSFGVIVDRVFDTEEIVVKPVATVLRHLKLYSGATILGDGSVILILDPKGMSLETGAGQAASAAETEAVAEAAQDETAAILVFRACNGALKAAPLASVSRIEEIASRELERVDGRTVIQYRGKLMPVIGSDGAEPQGWDDGGHRPLLVFTREDRAIGLLVDEVVDIVESSLASELEPAGAGAAGSLIIGDAATELIDVSYYWRAANGAASEPAPPVAALPPIAAAASTSATPLSSAKRVLLIDQSPFSQMLLRPLLGQAGYDVTVAPTPEAALALHGDGEMFHLIMVDTAQRGDAARRVAETLSQATAWTKTPMLCLGEQRISESLTAEGLAAEARTGEALRGAA